MSEGHNLRGLLQGYKNKQIKVLDIVRHLVTYLCIIDTNVSFFLLIENCQNGMDEKQNCPPPDCGIGKYYCPSDKTCKTNCDSSSNCPDVPVEIKCPPCKNGEFRCETSKLCIGKLIYWFKILALDGNGLERS